MRSLAISCLILFLIGCQQPHNQLRVGTISGPETELVEVAKEVAFQKYGLEVKIIEFNDYNLPNEALQDGSLDANVFQHLPYLKASAKAHGYNFQILGKTFVYPMAIYSNKFKSLSDLPVHAVIALPNDPSNEARALSLLEKAQLIELKKEATASLNDIKGNPKLFKFKEMDAAQLPRILTDVDAAVITTTYAIPAGLNPTEDALFTEDKNSPYANLIVIKQGSLKKEQLNLLVKALQSEQVEEKAQSLFGNAAIPAWNSK